MKQKFLVVTLLWCYLVTGQALADGMPQDTQRGPAGISAGEPLLNARAKLLGHGWKPVRRHADDGYEYSGAELQLTRRKIFEVDSCSMDSSRCILFYAKKGACLRMDTIGEQLKNMEVTRWVDECPDAPPRPSRDDAPKH
jgi:hypothetical protein